MAYPTHFHVLSLKFRNNLVFALAIAINGVYSVTLNDKIVIILFVVFFHILYLCNDNMTTLLLIDVVNFKLISYFLHITYYNDFLSVKTVKKKNEKMEK